MRILCLGNLVGSVATMGWNIRRCSVDRIDLNVSGQGHLIGSQGGGWLSSSLLDGLGDIDELEWRMVDAIGNRGRIRNFSLTANSFLKAFVMTDRRNC